MSKLVHSFKILGLAKTASKAEAKQAYLSLVKKYHPDVSTQTDKYKEIVEAYEFIVNSPETVEIDYENIIGNTYSPPKQAKKTQNIYFRSDFSPNFLHVLKKRRRRLERVKKEQHYTSPTEHYTKTLENESRSREQVSHKKSEKILMEALKLSVFSVSSYTLVSATDIYIGGMLSSFLFYGMYLSKLTSKI